MRFPFVGYGSGMRSVVQNPRQIRVIAPVARKLWPLAFDQLGEGLEEAARTPRDGGIGKREKASPRAHVRLLSV